MQPDENRTQIRWMLADQISENQRNPRHPRSLSSSISVSPESLH
jgi:hypothetical protein